VDGGAHERHGGTGPTADRPPYRLAGWSDTEHSGWSFCWMPENRARGWERPAGFAACRPGASLRGADELRREPEDNMARMPWCFGPDVATLRQKIAAVDARIVTEQELQERMWASIRRGIGAR
jgi:hypothetical protein